jgi:class 3 adenylate cyclase
VTFLFTDIEGSTRLLRQLRPELYAEARTEGRLPSIAEAAGLDLRRLG